MTWSYGADVSYEPPADLIQIELAFLQTDARCQALAAAHPSAGDILAGRATLTAEQAADYEAAWAALGQLRADLHSHPWWDTVDDRHQARQALIAAARASMNPT